ncbi:L-serine ammonia-lyase, iron-sulfur-dependent, subunit alpha, partial [Candidatus Bipolaricaulota bacterium]|nr:L-serine ammonia-lyase, iron-sulfur-dependent, subunit alpha [Candidatus Bipolaricaulota bacterium]
MNQQPSTLPSLFDTLKPAVGPSSSHTLGPMRAGLLFRKRLEAREERTPGEKIAVTLYGSLAHTGKGHLTDLAVVAGLRGYGPEDLNERSMSALYEEVATTGVLLLCSGGVVFQPERDIVFDKQTPPSPHPNTLRFILQDWEGRILLSVAYCSLGGGIVVEGSDLNQIGNVPIRHGISAHDIMQICEQQEEDLVDFALAMESTVYGHSRDEVFTHLLGIWTLMRRAIQRGLTTEGILPGSLRVERRATDMLRRFERQHGTPGVISAESTRASIYAIAVAEENAAGGSVVTAPTCGSAGVLPACLCIMQEAMHLSDERICQALLVASVIGELAIAKASIAGALVGCQ